MGRGRSGGNGGGGSSVKVIPYEDWKETREEIVDEDGNLVGVIEDERVYSYEPDIHPITKKDIIAEINSYRDDDGRYGDEDVSVGFAYEDGTVITGEDLDGKAFKRKGLIGAWISTPDNESVWGEEVHQGRRVPVQSWSEDGESGHTNSYVGYRTAGVRYRRIKTTFNNPDGKGGYKTIREVIAESTERRIN